MYIYNLISANPSTIHKQNTAGTVCPIQTTKPVIMYFTAKMQRYAPLAGATMESKQWFCQSVNNFVVYALPSQANRVVISWLIALNSLGDCSHKQCNGMLKISCLATKLLHKIFT